MPVAWLPAWMGAIGGIALLLGAGCLTDEPGADGGRPGLLESLASAASTTELGRGLVALPLPADGSSKANAYRLSVEEPGAPVRVRVGLVGPPLPSGSSWGLLVLSLEEWDGGAQWRWVRPVLPQGDEGWLGDGKGPANDAWVRNDLFVSVFDPFQFQNGPTRDLILIPFIQGHPGSGYAILVAALPPENETVTLPKDLRDAPIRVAVPLAEGLEASVASTIRPNCMFDNCSAEVFFGPIIHQTGSCSLPPPCQSTWTWQHEPQLRGGISFYSLYHAGYNGTWSRTVQARDIAWSENGFDFDGFQFGNRTDPTRGTAIEISVAGPGDHSLSLTLNVFSGHPYVPYRGWAADIDLEGLTAIPLEEFNNHREGLGVFRSPG